MNSKRLVVEKTNTTCKQWFLCESMFSITVFDSGASWFYNRFVRLFFVVCFCMCVCG